jgi:pimeloyl-ACP methyl ester carboxylesterase
VATTAESQAPSWPFYTPPETIDIRGVATAYRREGAGPTVVYLHGAGMTRRWLPFHQHLADRVDLLAPEQPGFGDTPLPEWLRSIEDVVLHLDDLLEALGIGEFHLVGNSLGGWIAAQYAVVYPRRLRSLTLISALGLRVPGFPLYDIFRMTPEEADEILFNGQAAQYGEYLEAGDAVEALVHGYGELTAAARLAWNPRYDHRLDRRLQRVTCPSLVVVADDDHVVPREHGERYAELLPNARLEVVSGTDAPTGHLAMVQEPAKLADLIAGFVTDQDSAR